MEVRSYKEFIGILRFLLLLISKKWLLIAAAAVVIVVAGLYVATSLLAPKLPDIKFATFRIEPHSVQVNQTAVITVNVESRENRIFNNLKVITAFEDPLYSQFLSIDSDVLPLPPLQNKEARTGEYDIRITAINLAGEEMRFKGIVSLLVDGKSTDSKQFDLTITK
jgi:hypothetical protein